MFSEFLSGPLFTVDVLATKWGEVHKTSTAIGEAIPDLDLRYAEEMDYDNIPVIQENRPIGYVCRKDIASDRILRASNLKPIGDWRIPPGTGLGETASILCERGTSGYPMFFVGNGDPPLGVLTYADLNRRSCYIYTYTMINFLEQWIKKRIIAHYSSGRWLDPRWMESLKGKETNHTNRTTGKRVTRWDQLDTVLRRGEGPLGLTYFADLMHVLEHDTALTLDKGELSDQVRSTSKNLRLKVAHPVKLLLPRSDDPSQLRQLRDFWQFMIPFIQRNDFNDKNGRWANEPPSKPRTVVST